MNSQIIKLIPLLILFFLTSCATPSQFYNKDTGISQYSSDVLYGVRIYEGKLPHYIDYESLGMVEGSDIVGMAVQKVMGARRNMLAEAKKIGANAVINVDASCSWGKVTYKGEAIIAREFPDKFEDIEDKPPISYSNSHIFKYDYQSVFNAVGDVLISELYDIEEIDKENGIIETKEIEASNPRFKWTGADFGGPYPIFKIKVLVERIDDQTTKVTEIDIFTGKGRSWKEGVVRKNSQIFFKEIRQHLKSAK